MKFIKEKYFKVFADKFVLGILIGAIGGLLANGATVQYQNYLEDNHFKQSLFQEIAYNSALINNINNGLVFEGDFNTEVWLSGLSTGKIYSLSQEDTSKLQVLYTNLGRENTIRAQYISSLYSGFSRNYDLAYILTDYQERVKSGLSLTENELQDYLAKKKEFDRSLNAVKFQQDGLNTIYHEANLRLKSELDQIKLEFGIADQEFDFSSLIR